MIIFRLMIIIILILLRIVIILIILLLSLRSFFSTGSPFGETPDTFIQAEARGGNRLQDNKHIIQYIILHDNVHVYIYIYIYIFIYLFFVRVGIRLRDMANLCTNLMEFRVIVVVIII